MCSSPSSSSRSRPGRAPVGVGVDDQLRPAAQRLVAGRVHVAEDHVGLQARFEAPVGAAVDGDDERADVADVGAQRLQVAAVAVAADDDQHVAVAEDGPGRRELDRAGQQVGLLADVGDGVLGELGERLVDPLALLGEAAPPARRRPAPGRAGPRARRADRAGGDRQLGAVVEQLEGVGVARRRSATTPARASSSGPAFG